MSRVCQAQRRRTRFRDVAKWYAGAALDIPYEFKPRATRSVDVSFFRPVFRQSTELVEVLAFRTTGDDAW